MKMSPSSPKHNLKDSEGISNTKGDNYDVIYATSNLSSRPVSNVISLLLLLERIYSEMSTMLSCSIFYLERK